MKALNLDPCCLSLRSMRTRTVRAPDNKSYMKSYTLIHTSGRLQVRACSGQCRAELSKETFNVRMQQESEGTELGLGSR